MQKVLLLPLFFALGIAAGAQNPTQYRAAADTGNTVAMIRLSELYQFGTGVSQSEDSANYWIEKAAGMGDADGLYLLGIRQCTQVYDEKVFAKGIKNLKKAADLNHRNACERLSEIYRRPTQENETDKFHSLSSAFLYGRKAADLGSEESCLFTADCLVRGRGASKNDSLANHYLLLAANTHNHPLAQVQIGERILKGKAPAQDPIFEALAFYQRAFNNPRANIDVRTSADLHIHEVDQILKEAQNLPLQGSPFLPQGSFQYRLREM